MQHVLRQLRNIPITSSVIASLYPDINRFARKMIDLEEENPFTWVLPSPLEVPFQASKQLGGGLSVPLTIGGGASQLKVEVLK